MSEMNWQVAAAVPKEFSDKFPEINPIVLQLLYNRGIKTQEAVDEFLNPDYGADIHSPFLFRDMEKAVTRILQAVEEKEKIVVYGDYDADGVSSSAVMVETLAKLGADVDVYIPYRETEGYGLNKEAVLELSKRGVSLVITVDCGISNVEEVRLLNENHIDIIITDHHHEPPTLPEAFAIINPNVAAETYPFRSLAGVGVAFKVAQGLVLRHKNFKVTPIPEGWEKWLLDLVAIGTIADLQLLLGENRTLVNYGLVVLRKTNRLGLRELLKSTNADLASVDEQVIGWQISPRLNAAGRLNHASSAYQLLITQSPEEALKLTQELNQTNQERQQLTEKVKTEAREVLGQFNGEKILIAVGKNWPTGVVGLVAGRITDQWHRPALVISHYNGEIIGSGRSIAEFNIIEALDECREYLARYGGHAQACGFTVKDEANLKLFIEKIKTLAETQLAGKDIAKSLFIDAQVELENVDWHLFEQLEKFFPHGVGNYKPRFVAHDLNIKEIQTVGKDGRHLRLMVQHKTQIIRKTIGFTFGEWRDKLKPGDKIDMVFEVDVNEWNGNRELQLKIIDLKSK
ncbi:MAG: single-stranded-DNA-specific exonuclease RecJ [Candidatus Buchananbacteria bacterium]|nr:single-stranded-DNA-specific exonuclease RecJ [Candidatus Buchananbacteria bacterium]